MPKQRKKKNFLKDLPKDPLTHQSRFKTRRGARFIPHVDIKLIPKGDVVVTEANHILGMPLTVSI